MLIFVVVLLSINLEMLSHRIWHLITCSHPSQQQIMTFSSRPLYYSMGKDTDYSVGQMMAIT